MAMGKRKDRQESLFIATDQIMPATGHPFYQKLNALLEEFAFDRWAEQRCAEYYEQKEKRGQPSIPPGVYVRMMLVGYFEGIDSQRGIAWRCGDSLSVRQFLGIPLDEGTPTHPTLTNTRKRLPKEVFEEMFEFVLKIAAEKQLISGQTVGVDSTLLEANAAMKSIVRKDTGEDWRQFVTRRMREEGVIGAKDEPTAEEVSRFDRKRKDKTVSNAEWQSSTDHAARIAKMKDGTTHLAYKAEHVVDLESDIVLAAEIYSADRGDTQTMTDSVMTAQVHLAEAGVTNTIEEVAADKGYHAAEVLETCAALDVRTYIPEPKRPHEAKWDNKPKEQRRAVENNRRRVQRTKGKKLQRRRSEVVERTFAHICNTGGGRRSWLRGLIDVGKRHLLAAAAHNLGRIMRRLHGIGKPKGLQGEGGLADLAQLLCAGWATLVPRTLFVHRRPTEMWKHPIHRAAT